MGSQRVVVMVIGFAMMLSRAAAVTTPMDCTTVVGLFSACNTFVTYGSPDPMPGSPCCDAVGSLNSVADSTADGRQMVCNCLMGLITTYSPNATAIATLPGFCGVSLGFTIEPNTDCDFIP